MGKEGFMKLKWWMNTFLIILAGLLVTNCAKPYVKTPFIAPDLSANLSQGYKQKVDNFLIILDTSATMAERHDYWSMRDARSKLNVAKDIISNINETIDGLKLNGGLRVFGSQMALVYGMTPHTVAGLDAALDSITKGEGLSPIGTAIDAGTADLESVSGKTAVILLTDGIEDPETAPVAAAQRMKSRYGDRVCIYTILIGDNKQGKNIMQKIADAGECGFFVAHVSEKGENGNIAEFAEKVFLEEVVVADADGDGVIDSRDRCPDTPSGVVVDASGCPLDSDRDGVYDYLDRCPDTPRGLAVDQNGCPLPIKESVSIELLVQFDFDKAVVKPEYHEHLRGVANFLKTYPDTKITLNGYTDWIGTEGYNLGLSERRAASVKAYLVDKFGIDAARLKTRGYGESQPVASNETREGRRRNRRVVAEISTMTTK
jgi:OOP family OmpA-OmpF porin